MYFQLFRSSRSRVSQPSTTTTLQTQCLNLQGRECMPLFNPSTMKQPLTQKMVLNTKPMTTLLYMRILPHLHTWYATTQITINSMEIRGMRWVFVPQSEVYSTGSVFDSAGTYVPTLVRIPLSSVWSQVTSVCPH